MAELTTLARPYARAAFKVALSESDLSTWADRLGTAAAITLRDQVKAFLQSPSLTDEQKSDLFIQVMGDTSPTFQNFIAVLADNDRLPLLRHIRELFLALKAQHESTVEVDITSAYALSKETESKLEQALAKHLGRSVKLSSDVDASLLGGALIRAGDTVIDGSVKGRLAQLAETLDA